MAGKRASGKRVAAAETPSPAPVAPAGVSVVIRAGHRHRGERFEVDTPRIVTPDEAERLRLFGALVQG